MPGESTTDKDCQVSARPGHPVSRRLFCSTATAMIMSGCAASHPGREPKVHALCKPPAADSPNMLRIDMHCHLFNHKDLSGSAFISRRLGDFTNRNTALLEPAVAVLSSMVLSVLGLATNTINADIDLLKSVDGGDFESLCKAANEAQPGISYGKGGRPEDYGRPVIGDGRITGMASNRTRNAAVMMAQFPDVDIFTPSMVDFFEGQLLRRSDDNTAIASEPFEQAGVYRALHLATHGRFLPMISFTPERQAVEDPDFKYGINTPLALVKKSILEDGFVGVKVHPAAGFNPVDNFEHGCSNTLLQVRTRMGMVEIPEEQAEKYDRAMRELFTFCEDHDVPILTHGSTGIPANRRCMFKDRDPLEWTNSPRHWAKAIEHHPRLKVCLAHFAGRFATFGEFGKIEQSVTYENGRLKPSPWLKEALRFASASTNDKGFYFDLSSMPQLAQSAAEAKAAAWKYETTMLGRLLGDFTDSNDGKYAKAFTAFLEDPANAVLGRRLMYGTDLHMPGVSIVGLGDQYERLIESVLPPGNTRAGIMGRNAVDFFGLRSGEQNRRRLEAFYKANGIDTGKVRWMQRLEHLEIDT